MFTFLVKASHIWAPRYSFTDGTVVTVRETRISATQLGFYASHPVLGCGKTYRTTHAAIRALFEDHACTVLNIQREHSISEYRMKGQLDALQGKPQFYGPHYGMRSTYDFARSEYAIGWHEVNHYLTRGDTMQAETRE